MPFARPLCFLATLLFACGTSGDDGLSAPVAPGSGGAATAGGSEGGSRGDGGASGTIAAGAGSGGAPTLGGGAGGKTHLQGGAAGEPAAGAGGTTTTAGTGGSAEAGAGGGGSGGANVGGSGGSGACVGVPDGTQTANVAPDDCVVTACEMGLPKDVPADGEVPPSDDDPCTTDTCANGEATYVPLKSGASCGDGLVCDDAGMCIAVDLCGNGAIDPGEDCDGSVPASATCNTQGFDGGKLACSAACTFDTSGCANTPKCGDGKKGPLEQCDGTDIGNQTCASIGLGASGTLRCSADCRLDTSTCAATIVVFGGSLDGSAAASQLRQSTWEWKGSWSQAVTTTQPSARYWAAMAGAADGTVVLFGGYDGAYRDDTWTWDGQTWTQQMPGHVPPARFAANIGTLDGKVVMFGGYNGNALADTWEWDGSDWTNKDPKHAPAGHDGCALANIGGQRLVLFGGSTQTWEWDGDDWTQRNPAHHPSMRQYLQSATYNGTVILFAGGTSNTNTATLYDDTWSWDGLDWTQLVQHGPPDPRRGHAVGPTGDGVFMFSGLGPGVVEPGTWQWNGTTWILEKPDNGPSGRVGVYAAAR